jgi:hypothetical protein
MSGGVAAFGTGPNPLEHPSQAVRPGDRHNCEDGAHRKVLSQRGAEPEERKNRDLRGDRDAESGQHISDRFDEGHRTRLAHAAARPLPSRTVLAREPLPALDNHVAIARVDLHREAHATGAFGGDDRGAAAREGLVNRVILGSRRARARSAA